MCENRAGGKEARGMGRSGINAVVATALGVWLLSVPAGWCGVTGDENLPPVIPCENAPDGDCCENKICPTTCPDPPPPTTVLAGGPGCATGGCGGGGGPVFGSGDATIASLQFILHLGGAAFPGALNGGRLILFSEDATASLATPAALDYDRATRITGVSDAKTIAGAPRDVYLRNRNGIDVTFRFANGSTTGIPQDPFRAHSYRLVMVNAAGAPVLSSPTYYDLVYKTGAIDRFALAPGGDGVWGFDSFCYSTGRWITLEDSQIDIKWDGDSNLRQIKVAQGLANIVTNTPFKYSIEIFQQSDVIGLGGDGLYATMNSPLVSWIIENPDTTNSHDRLTITRKVGLSETAYNYQYASAGSTRTWTLTSGGLVVNGARRVTDDSETIEEIFYETRDTNGAVFASHSELNKELGWGKAPIRTVIDPDGLALTTTNTYYTNASEPGRYSRLKSRLNPDGSWKRYDYDSYGRLSKVVESWKDADITAAEADVQVTLYSYAGLGGAPDPATTDQRPRTLTEKIEDTVVSVTYHDYQTVDGAQVHITERAANGTAGYGAAGNLRTTRTYYPQSSNLAQSGRLQSLEHPDGRLESYSYEFGTLSAETDPSLRIFTPDSEGSSCRTTITHGAVNAPTGVAWKTTRETGITDPTGNIILSETYVYEGGTAYTRISWTARDFDGYGHITAEYHSDGTQADYAWSGCCGMEWSTDRSGIVQYYAYDELGRRTDTIKAGLHSPTNDIWTTVTYDAAGRVISRRAHSGGLSLLSTSEYDTAGRLSKATDAAGISTTYLYSGNGLTNTTIRAGLTNVAVRGRDGRTKYTEINGVRKQTYEYGVNGGDGTQWTKVYTGPDGTSSAMWSKTTTDLMGRTVKSEKPGFGDSVTLTSQYFYNAAGQMTNVTSAGTADTLYGYDQLGNQATNCVDINGNGVIDLSGPDRVSENRTYFEEDGSSNIWRVSESLVYAEEDGSTPTTNSVQKTQLSGLSPSKTSEMVSIDIYGNQAVATTAVDRDNKTVTQTVDHPDSTNDSVSVTVNGLMMTSEGKTGQATTYGYDALGRRTNVADPRTGTSTTHYNTKGQVDWVEDAASNRTSYAYDAATGRRTAVTNAVGDATYYHYDPEGHLLGTWGSVYPVAYAYDDQGRMTSMFTLRDSSLIIDEYSDFTSNKSSFDATEWKYDDATGLLTNKVYADTNGTAYAYTSDGKLSKRIWARENYTEYAYDSCCGALTNISYFASDDSPDAVTTNISFTFDRLGRQATVTDAVGLRTFAYDTDALQLVSETVVTTEGVTNVIARSYDSTGRGAGLDLDGDYSAGYMYSDIGRLSAVTWSNAVIDNVYTATYAYVANSDLIAGYDVNVGADVYKTRKSFEANRNLISAVSNLWNTTGISTYAYGNDAIGRRTNRIDSGLSPATNAFGYNVRSELVDADMGTNAYGYAYDPIGNRQTYTNNADVWTYLANELNQYTNVADGVTNTPTYDMDGNMLTYGGWTFGWNGENRLINASNSTHQISYSYDYMGRRFSKVVDDGSTVTTNQFTYDGWNLIAETDGTTTNHYVWGLDLSGSMQGAGGIGGLLATVQDGEAYFSCFDANGNLTDYVGTNGTVAAHYEYGPFGGTIASSGTKADDFRFRFSTKYLDDETALYYYGLRYFSPELGRWPSRDPIGEKGGVLLYGFVQNGAVNEIDVLGQNALSDLWAAIVSSGISLFNFSWAASEALAENAFAIGLDQGVSLVVGPLGFKAGINVMWFPEKCEFALFKYASGALAPASSSPILSPVETWLETVSVGWNIGASVELVVGAPLGTGTHDADSWLGWFSTASAGVTPPGIPLGVSGSAFGSADWLGLSAGMGLSAGGPVSGDIGYVWFDKAGWDSGSGYWSAYDNKCLCMALRTVLMSNTSGAVMGVLNAIVDWL